ncbi:MAG: discoidin domain-containing protein [Pirellulales bacterium]|nr:discoidin domain-containing protein [Pirellulales bacterium]
MCRTRSGWLPAIFVVSGAAVMFPAPAPAAVYNLHLSTDNGPDYTDLESFVRSVTEGCRTPQEKCIAVWRWGRRSRRQTSCAQEDGRLIWDPILHYNSYGAMNCGVISALNMVSYLQLGYRARYVQLGDHTVSEVSWDDGRSWHLFDSSMSFFCYNHRGEVAGCQEIQEAHGCELSGGKSEPGHYYFYHGAPQCISHRGHDGWRFCCDQPVLYERTLWNGASSYTDGFSPDQYTLHARYGRRYILNLRPGECYTRHWKPLDGEGSGVADDQRPDYYRPVNGRDPDRQHGLHNLRGNGLWVFEPELGTPDGRRLFYDSRGIETRAESGDGPNLHPARPGEPAMVVLKTSAANVITSMRIEAEGVRSGSEDLLQVSVSRTAGVRWTPVWQSRQAGKQQIRLTLRDEVAGVTEALVKIEIFAAAKTADVGLDTLRITTRTQLNRRTLPKLTLGTNRVRLSAGEQVASTVLWPPLHAGLYRQTVDTEQDVHSTEQPDGMYKATLGAASDGKECFAAWRVEVPTDITAVTYGVVVTNRSDRSYVSLRQSFDGRSFAEFFRKSDGDAPFDAQVLHTVAAAGGTAAARQAWLKCVFFCPGAAATYNMPGIQDLLIRIDHKPRDARFQPIEVTYHWTEHRSTGDLARWHTELVESLPHQYRLNVAGVRDPTMNWVRLKLQDSVRPGETPAYGYSDGQDVGPGFEPAAVTYVWGNNVALQRPYTASRPSDEASGNPDTESRELTNGQIIAPTDLVTSRPVHAATAFWAPGEPIAVVVDLGGARPVGGVRVSTHQPNADYGHPQRVEVAVSADGKTWQPGGTIRHDDLWTPPADYEPWEHDDNPKYADLPGGGRLAYRYPLSLPRPIRGRYVRFTCFPLPGRGMGLSELEVFDRVEVQRQDSREGN